MFQGSWLPVLAINSPEWFLDWSSFYRFTGFFQPCTESARIPRAILG